MDRIEDENWRKRRGEKEKMVWWWGREAKGVDGRRKFFPCIGIWMLRILMQVLIKRIQKRKASSFVWWCGRGSVGGVTLSPHPACPAALQLCFHILPLSHQAALVYLNIGRSHRVKVTKRIERHSTPFFLLLDSPHWIPASPNPPCCLWQGKWSSSFIHLLNPWIKASHYKEWG